MSSCLSLRPPNAAVISPACVCGHIQFVPPNVCVSSPGAAITSFVSFETHAAHDTVDEYRLLTLITGSRERQKKHKKRRCRSGLPGGRFLFYPFICFLPSIDRDSFSSSHNIVSSYCSVCAGDCPKVFLFSKVKKVSKPACVRVLSLLIHMSSCCGQISNSQSTHGPILNSHPALQYHHVVKAVKGS